MTALTAFTWVFAGLLVVSGGHKLGHPAATTAALQGARLPSGDRLVRLLGLFEVALGGAAIVVGGRAPAAVVAATYAGFAVFAGRQARRGEDCGCFGQTPAPATRLHVAVNATAAVAAAASTLQPGPSFVALLAREHLTGLVAAALLALACGAVRLLLTGLPALAVAAARVLEEPGA